jgi:hypothetical protein
MASRIATSRIAPPRILRKALAQLVPLALLSVPLVHGQGPVHDDTVAIARAPEAPARPPDPGLDRRIRSIRLRYRQAELARVHSIRFTVLEESDGSEGYRHWIWFPRADSVFFHGKDPKGLVLQAGYSRKNPWSRTSETVARIDSAFTRDRFILLFPQLFAAEPGGDIRMEGNSPAGREAAGGGAAWIRIRYPADDRGRPWDVYEVLADTGGVIRAWTVRGRGPGSGPMRFDWSPPQDVDGLPLSLERKGPRGFWIRFTDVKVAWDRP